ncbi:Translation machinery-associated protein 16 [[Candida] zeylanoides]
MPVSHSLSKVSKSISKSKGHLHIKGRKFKQLNRATLRDNKLNTRKQKSQDLRDKELLSVKFIQEAVRNRPEKEVFTLDDMKSFLEGYVSRFDEELVELREARRPGRPATSRQQILEEMVKHEQGIYETGFKCPDLTDKPTVDRLRLWTGSSGGTTVMKFVFVNKDMIDLPNKADHEMAS